MTTPKLRWGILSTGSIANQLAGSISKSTTSEIVAVASRTEEGSRAFSGRHGTRHAHADYGSLIGNPEVDIVYVAPPHPMHVEWAVRAAEAGKHVLCEKPAGMSAAEVEEMTAAAKKHGVFFMEAFMYRCHPQIQTLRSLIRTGEIGTVRMIHAALSFYRGPYATDDRLISKKLGGGAILDVGCYVASMARMVAGEASGGRHAEPTEVKSLSRLEPREQTDLISTAMLSFGDGPIAMLQCGMQFWSENIVRIEGDAGWITLTSPWFAEAGKSTIRIHDQQSGGERILNTATI
jgi:predicted dehydrogenase